MKSKSKKHCQVIHAKRRAYERYDLELNRAKYKNMLTQFQESISTGKNSTFIRKISNRMSIHDFIYEGATYTIVYDKERKTIVTFLPENNEEKTRVEIVQNQSND